MISIGPFNVERPWERSANADPRTISRRKSSILSHWSPNTPESMTAVSRPSRLSLQPFTGFPSPDDLSKAIRLIAKYIGRDWSRLYWQLPFYPSRGHEEVSRDINHIDDKYHRGDVFHVTFPSHGETMTSCSLCRSKRKMLWVNGDVFTLELNLKIWLKLFKWFIDRILSRWSTGEFSRRIVLTTKNSKRSIRARRKSRI